MNYNNKFLLLIIAICLSLSVSARKKLYYNSNIKYIGVAGDYEILEDNGFYDFHINDINIEFPRNLDAKMTEKWLNDNSIGKKVFDYLFCYNGYSLSSWRLEQRAMENATKADQERANYGILHGADILKSDDAITRLALKNNFIFIIKPHKRSSQKLTWEVYEVVVTDGTLNEVYNSWNDMHKYNTIKPAVKFVASGSYKVQNESDKTPDDNIIDLIRAMTKEDINKTIRSISKKVPEFAIRGKVESRSPFKASVGEDNGLRNRDKMVIYRSKQDKKGNLYSSRIATVRAANVKSDTTNLYTFAGKQASSKQGDVAVLRQDHNSSYSLLANYMDHSFGINLTYDHRMSFSKTGISQYLMTNIGCSVYEGFRKRLYFTERNDLVHSPILFDIGIGYGVGFEFAHCIEIVPYILAEYEGAYFMKKEIKVHDENQDESTIIKARSEDAYSHSVRVPIGLKAHINIMYPVQLVFGAEYVINCNIPRDKKDIKSNPRTFFYKPMNYKRYGLNMLAGLRVNF